jgi:choline dehydrogenase-like flavoprotein
MFDFDALIIGSGFGGSVTSCRLAQKGYKVLVLERGQRWDPTTFPRKPDDSGSSTPPTRPRVTAGSTSASSAT